MRINRKGLVTYLKISRVINRLNAAFPAASYSKDTVLVILINLVLAVVAFGKDMFLAAYLGTSAEADAFLVSYFVVDTLGNNLLATALGIAGLPVLAGLKMQGLKQRFNKAVLAMAVFSLLAGGILTLLMWMGREPILDLFGSGLTPATVRLGTSVFSIILPAMVLFPLASVGTSILQVHGRFSLPALGPVVFNAVFLAGLIGLWQATIPPAQGVRWLGMAILAALCTMLITLWLPIFKSGQVRLGRLGWGLSSELQAVFRRFLPYLAVIMSTQVTYAVERYLAAGQGIGNVAALNYAFRLVQFPIWVFVAAVSNVMFPAMAKAYSRGENPEFRRLVRKSLGACILVTVPVMLILFLGRRPIVALLFERGAFSAYSVGITATIMGGYTLTIVWQGVSTILLRALLSIGRTGLGTIAAWLAFIVNVGFDFSTVPVIGVSGIGYGAALGAFINALLLLVFFRWATRVRPITS